MELLIIVLGSIILFFYFPLLRSRQPLDHSAFFRRSRWFV